MKTIFLEPDAKTENGETALIAACKQNMKEVVKLLLQFKANPDFSFTPSGSSVLHIGKKDIERKMK